MQCNCSVSGCGNRVFLDGADVTLISAHFPEWVALPNGDHLPTRERRVTLTPDQMRELAADLLAQAGRKGQ